MIDLRLAPCSHTVARDAVTRWHYSGGMGRTSSDRYEVREDGEFVGVVVFSNGSNCNIGKPYGLGHGEVRELIRVALGPHRTPTSRIVAIALRLLRAARPALRLVVSYADTREGHHGGIYQAGGWIYLGEIEPVYTFRIHGRETHKKSCFRSYGTNSIAWIRANVDPNARRVRSLPKHKYLMPLDAGMRALVAPLAKPYPKRATSIDGDAPASQAGQGGSIPTVALCNTAPTEAA